MALVNSEKDVTVTKLFIHMWLFILYFRELQFSLNETYTTIFFISRVLNKALRWATETLEYSGMRMMQCE